MQRVSPKPYLYVDDLAALVRWTAEAIRTKVRRGEFQRGVHYFQEGHRARLIFKWDAIVAFIERTPPAADVAAPDGHRRAVLNIEQATAALCRLCTNPPSRRSPSSTMKVGTPMRKANPTRPDVVWSGKQLFALDVDRDVITLSDLE